MADISQYLQAIMNAIYGEDVRGSIHDAIQIINAVGEVVLTTGTAITGPTSSSTGFFDGSLYLNTNTFELWKCVGTDSWSSQGNIKGDKGDPGDDGTIWYRGTGISGKAINPTVYSGSGVADANAEDYFLNPNEGAVYYCVSGGDPLTATWSYYFTMAGGSSAAIDVAYDNTTSGLTATNVQNAIDEVVSDLDEFTTSVFAQADATLGMIVIFDDLNPSYGYMLCFDDQNAATLPNPIPSQVGDPIKDNGTNTGIKLTYKLANASGTSKFALRILK